MARAIRFSPKSYGILAEEVDIPLFSFHAFALMLAVSCDEPIFAFVVDDDGEWDIYTLAEFLEKWTAVSKLKEQLWIKVIPK
jgi:hypothetical protein